MKTKTKPTLALLTLILLANCTAFAQTSYLKNRWAAQATFIPDFRKNFGDRKVHNCYPSYSKRVIFVSIYI